MELSSCLFLFIFFPIAFLLFYIMPNKLRKGYLLIISLLFYLCQSLKTLPVLIFSIIMNYVFGFAINKSNKKKTFLILGILFNFILLVFYKYTNFITDNLNSVLNTSIPIINLVLPLGISFFTFQEISYLADIYKEKIKFDKNIVNFALYICFFPRIISGPIVRYEQFQESIVNLKKPSTDVIYNRNKKNVFGFRKSPNIVKRYGRNLELDI